MVIQESSLLATIDFHEDRPLLSDFSLTLEILQKTYLIRMVNQQSDNAPMLFDLVPQQREVGNLVHRNRKTI